MTHTQDMPTFLKHFDGPLFVNSDVYETVVNRCFDKQLHPELYDIADRVLGGRGTASDVSSLQRIGWWKDDGIISDFFRNVILSKIGIKRQINEPRYLSKTIEPERNAEKVIVTGFELMKHIDFECLERGNKVAIENALSYNWATKVISGFRNAYLRSQETSSNNKGHVDYYLNGFADTAIEFIRDATTKTEKAKNVRDTDIDLHLNRFLTKDYPWKRFAIVNFAISHRKIVLPKDSAHHEKIYTYVHKTNSLYRGEK